MNKTLFPPALTLRDPANVPKAGKPVGELQDALKRLKLDITPSDIARKQLGASTAQALSTFQAKAGLPADGKLTPETVARINSQVAHDFIADSKTRTQRLQALLQRTGAKLDDADIKGRVIGPSTDQAVKAFQTRSGLAADGRIDEALLEKLRGAALSSQLGAKVQVARVQSTLLRALNIAKLGKDVRVDSAELKGRVIGPSTSAAIKALQTKYQLPATGQLDPATLERMQSIAASIASPPRLLKAVDAAELKPLKRAARLNMTSQHVGDAQAALTFLGFRLDEAEFKDKVFGRSTREAVLAYQKSRLLPVDGHVAGNTLDRLNTEIQRVNPPVPGSEHPWRLRGSVRNASWQGVAGATVQIWHQPPGGAPVLLGQRKTAGNGFFDFPYDPPRDVATRQIRGSFQLQVKALDAANLQLGSKLLANPTQIAWVNFTQGDQPYRGTSEFDARMGVVSKAITPVAVANLVEKPQQRQITQAAATAKLTADDVMRLVLAHLVAARINQPLLDAPACYAFIGQNLPSALPGDLIDSTVDWTLIDSLVDLASNGLAFMDSDSQAQAFANAMTLNLMPIAVGLKKDAVLAALAQLKQSYVLEKPILVGNASLKTLLTASTVAPAHFDTVAAAFLTHKHFGNEFWADAEARPDQFGGAAALQDLKLTIDVGHVTKNFPPMLTALKQKIGDVNDPSLKSARDMAKLTQADWVGLINANGGQVPASTDGLAAGDKVQAYATVLATQSERLFPAVALVAAVARSPANPLPNVQAVQTLFDAHPDFDLRSGNLDVFVQQRGLAVDAATMTEARAMQRVHRIAPTALAGQVLLDNKLHNSSQIVAMGKDQFAATLTQDKRVDLRTALTVFGRAEGQYAQVLQRIADYRFDMHRADPKAIVDHTYTPAELPAELLAVPNLATLFGSLDFCACAHCQSVYGPAAYLADVLRFLDKHPSEVAGKTVQAVLLDRRPDIGNIKLNCSNTETPLPYIDLVCEVLESAIAAPTAVPNFSFQTTRSAAELRAAPEHVREEAYVKLRSADFPLNVAFDLWQEQARVFLHHLGLPRWQLMEAFQTPVAAPAALPTDASIAGEYWNLSTHETAIVCAAADDTDARQRVYWGIAGAALPAALSVADVMRRSFLDYGQLLDLLSVRWINPAGDAANVVVERPDATCDTELQQLTLLTAGRLDKLHRFLRLWRHTGWAMWELDLLIRSAAVGNGVLDAQCLVRLKQFAALQKRLGLPADRALGLFADLVIEPRVDPAQPQVAIPSLYERLFLNPLILSPVDAAFALPIAAGASIAAKKGTVLAAFSLTDADLALLLTRIASDALTLANLSRIGRYSALAQRLGLGVKDLLTLESLSGVADVFATPKTTLDFIDRIDWATRSAFTVDELAYLLNPSSASTVGLRDEVIAQQLDALREALRANTGSTPEGVIAAQTAANFALTPEQAQMLLANLRIGAVTLLALLQTPAFLARNADGSFSTPITALGFPDLYNAQRLLHKAALAVSRFKLDAVGLDWLLANAARFELLDLAALPVVAAPAAAQFPAWLALAKFRSFEALYPEPEGMSLRRIFELAAVAATPVADIKAALAGLTQWTAEEVTDVTAALALQQGAGVSDYAVVTSYLRMETCLKASRRIGVTVARVAAWALRDDDTGDAQKTTAQQTRQAAKSKYDEAVWLERVTPLEDALREKKRDALIGYLVANALVTIPPQITQGAKQYANPAYWRDANDLLKYFLIDVEMCSCQLTSRIKQATGSVQMFVQRCLLGLEQPSVEVSRAALQDTSSDNSWKQWKWMKNYRLWEANRKVFLYPENWIEPELRDDKSPFFEDLENEIAQSDVTDENAEAAFLNYVHKVHEVARLDIVGAYYELDDTDPRDQLPVDTNLMHVIGRTKAHPAIHYYRHFDLNSVEWSAWEKIDLDIQSEQVVPVVYNRRLHLFWLSFVEKPQKVKKMPPATQATPDAQGKVNPTDAPEPPNQLELQLCWSARKDGGWTTKRVSRHKLIHPWQRPQSSYNMKPRYKSRENLLWLDIYISQTLEFNNTLFWDAYRNSRNFATQKRYDETARPWHSSSFVFDGDVVDIKMKALRGDYRLLDANGILSGALSTATSVDYLHDNFGDDGRAINPLTGRYEIAPRLPLPGGMHYQNTRLANNKRTLNASGANVLENGQSRTLLGGARSPFEIVASQHSITFDTAAFGPVPFFYQDSARSFFIKPEWQTVIAGYNQPLQSYNYEFFPFYHPYTALFLRELNRTGIDGLLNRRIQTSPQTYYPGNNFAFSSYSPGATSLPDKTALIDSVDFERYGAYALYNWEIFFHAPLMIACRLSQNQRFDEAMRWFHYIFDPTNTESPDVPQRYWITRPFFEQNSDAYRAQRIDNLLKNIGQHSGELSAWKNNPFKPHLIARGRPVAYQKNVVMKYIDNLIAWGDQLFRGDTIEAINEATTLYVLAYELLGRRPVKVPNVDHADLSYRELSSGDGLDPFGNKQVEVLMENFIGTPVRVTRTPSGTEPLPTLNVFYFSIPNNDRLLEYWDTVEDRLFKIRHCMNLQGVVRQLPLFEPAIDPALLVKAAAAGIDLGSVVNDLRASAGPYRYPRLAQKALELCGEVKALGADLLAALEKSDAEGLALLRSTQEVTLQQAMRAVRKQQIDEANGTLAALGKSRELAQKKQDFYAGRDFMNAWEGTAVGLSGLSAAMQTSLAVGYALAGGLALIPRITGGMSGFGASPVVTVDPLDGKNLAEAASLGVTTLSAIMSAIDRASSLATTLGGYARRQDEWNFQADLATTEIAQIEQQIAAAEIRVAIAETELENHDLRTEQAQAIDDYMRSKYSNRQLYDWQVKQLGTVYFQSYQLAYDMAKRSERCFQNELGDWSGNFIQFGYWDSLKKGLLAGERLTGDIQRMEAAYLDQHVRDLEITKQVSLAQLFPLSLLALKETGACSVRLDEWLFDLDYPGHYFRRLKSVAISIPCVVGPYTSINCTLALTNNGIRIATGVAAGYGDALVGGDARFRSGTAATTAIATSQAQNDAGLFELNFNDDRFLPFEGAGAACEFRIDLPIANNQFDRATVSDVILTLRLTAKVSGDAALAAAATANLLAILPTAGQRMWVLHQEFGDAWYRFLHPAAGQDQVLAFTVGLEHLPFYLRGKQNIKPTRIDLIVEGPTGVTFSMELTAPGDAVDNTLVLQAAATYGDCPFASKTAFTPTARVVGTWQIKIRQTGVVDFRSLAPDVLRNAYLVVGYSTS